MKAKNKTVTENKQIHVAERRDFNAYLFNGTEHPKMAILFKDKSKSSVALDPDDYVPGYEPAAGLKASELALAFDDKKNKMKPEEVALIKKFGGGGRPGQEGFSKTKYNLENALDYHLGQLNEACVVLELIGNSDPVICAPPDHPEDLKRSLRQLSASFEMVSDKMREHAQKAHEIWAENRFKIDGEPVVPDCVKKDYIFQDE